MRIDMLKPQPAPEIPKVSESSSPSVNYDQEYQDVKKKALSSGTEKAGAKKDRRDESADSAETPARSRRKIQFTVHHNPNEVITQIVDSRSGNVVEEIPPEKNQDTLRTFPDEKGKTLDQTV